MDDFCEEMPKKEKYEIRLDVYFDCEITKEEAERHIYGALRKVGMTGYKGTIS